MALLIFWRLLKKIIGSPWLSCQVVPFIYLYYFILFYFCLKGHPFELGIWWAVMGLHSCSSYGARLFGYFLVRVWHTRLWWSVIRGTTPAGLFKTGEPSSLQFEIWRTLVYFKKKNFTYFAMDLKLTSLLRFFFKFPGWNDGCNGSVMRFLWWPSRVSKPVLYILRMANLN